VDQGSLRGFFDGHGVGSGDKKGGPL